MKRRVTGFLQWMPRPLKWSGLVVALSAMTGCAQLSSVQSSASDNPTADASAASATGKLPIEDAPFEAAYQTLSIETLETLTLQGLYRLQSLTLDSDDTTGLDQLYVFSDPKPVYDNLWDTIGDHLFLTPANTHNYQDYIQSYLNKKAYLQRVSKRAKPYLYFILQEIQKRQMPFEMALLPIVESGYYPYARSYMSAAGLWQFMPATGYMYGLKRNWWYDGRHDVYRSTLAALDYLQSLYKQNNYDWLLALASYNAGYGNVRKATRKLHRARPDAPVTFWNLQPYLPRETRHYVPQLLAISHIIGQRERYQVPLEPVANKPFLAAIDIRGQVSLQKVAQQTEVSTKLLKNLNPGFLRQATPPDGQHKLVLPLTVAERFNNDYQQAPDKYAVNWRRHQIRNGENLGVIAQRYGTRVALIKQLNNMRSDFIRAGKTLLIPVPGGESSTQLASRSGSDSYRHTVRRGESLWTIARTYDTSINQLARWNGLSRNDTLRPGQRLRIQMDGSSSRKISYTLKKGESLWVVARKYQVTTDDLCKWNGVSANDVLQPGTELQVWIKS
ncbi:MAG: LysM peptidoglycan-binding domain-containing protein [Hydrogenovibrio sp.]|uniref:lytic transglycosylase n=1 Tax=Hydrogenovibrio sp. TaxID=2065821 RepID=UPI00287041E7|nr:LysM peptidoglycan-binding domain-containing protein [Hydrogenovibrio sp.]MDR9498636.1 LysM peptidoglycan-binding domain-containing protein [Hydrogenovibrio sp.]